jgi:hypothetical protein
MPEGKPKIHKRPRRDKGPLRGGFAPPLYSLMYGQIPFGIVYCNIMNFRSIHAIRHPSSAVIKAIALTLAWWIYVPCFGQDAKAAGVDNANKKSKSGIQQIIFEEQKIEGKIRRPQMVLIKADQRPAFAPMILQSFGKNENIADFVDPAAIENMPNQDAFQFNGTKISNFVP